MGIRLVKGQGAKNGDDPKKMDILFDSTKVGYILYDTRDSADLPHDIPPHNVYVSYIVIFPGYRGRGFGGDAMMEFMRARKKAGDVLMVVSPAEGLDGYWESLGFEPLNTYYYPSGGALRPLFRGRKL